jgi:hypothetical protein
MKMRWRAARPSGRAVHRLGAAGLLAATMAAAQSSRLQDQTGIPVERSHPDRIPDRPTIPPAITIPIEPLGFSPPNTIYLGQRYSMASLDFIGEDRLLFTFRVPGLIHRQRGQGDEEESDEHHIKAMILTLPAGLTEAETVWTLHDRARYLWMLKDGQFLLRDRDELERGDGTLELKPYLRFPGPLYAVEMDPTQQYLVTNSREPATAPQPGEVPRPSTAAASVTPDPAPGKTAASEPGVVLRILRRDSGKVMLVSRVRSPVRVPINTEGYLDFLPGRREDWVITLNKFTGDKATLGQVDSTCTPSYEFLSQREFLVSTCDRSELRSMLAMDTDGHRLWLEMPSSSPVWPLMKVSADGSRLARESLVANHPVSAFSPLSFDDVKGQIVEVFDAATGKIVFTAAANPVFDAGGNVALSPSGRRIAVLNAGAIQVFDLPAAGPAPGAPAQAQTGKSGP